MKITKTKIKDCILIEPRIFKDDRGFFLETYQRNKYETFIPAEHEFVQIMSLFQKNVLRGLHFQRNNPQGKLVRVLEGKVFDVVADLRQNSKTLVSMQSFWIIQSKINFGYPRFCSWFPHID